jgi:hypothetical protein
LVEQDATTLTTPFNQTFREKVRSFEIHPESFEKIKQEIRQEGIRMDADLLIDKKNALFKMAEEINKGISS